MVIDIDSGVSEQIISGLRAHEKWADLANLMEDDIQRILPTPERLRAVWQSMGRLSLLGATHNIPLDRDSIGRNWQSTIDSLLESLRSRVRASQEVRSHNQAVPSLPQLLKVIGEVEAFRSETLDHWPWTPQKEEWDEAIAEFERGEGVDIDDAFAEAAGLSRGDWLRLVEERRRTRDGAGQ